MALATSLLYMIVSAIEYYKSKNFKIWNAIITILFGAFVFLKIKHLPGGVFINSLFISTLMVILIKNIIEIKKATKRL